MWIDSLSDVLIGSVDVVSSSWLSWPSAFSGGEQLSLTSAASVIILRSNDGCKGSNVDDFTQEKVCMFRSGCLLESEGAGIQCVASLSVNT